MADSNFSTASCLAPLHQVEVGEVRVGCGPQGLHLDRFFERALRLLEVLHVGVHPAEQVEGKDVLRVFFDPLAADRNGRGVLLLLDLSLDQLRQKLGGHLVLLVALLELRQRLLRFFLEPVKAAQLEVAQGVLRVFLDDRLVGLLGFGVFFRLGQKVAQVRPRGRVVGVEFHDLAQLLFGGRHVLLEGVDAREGLIHLLGFRVDPQRALKHGNGQVKLLVEDVGARQAQVAGDELRLLAHHRAELACGVHPVALAAGRCRPG